MARKKLSPLATLLTIGAVGLTGFAVYKFLIKPMRERKKALNDIAIMDTEYVDITDQNQA